MRPPWTLVRGGALDKRRPHARRCGEGVSSSTPYHRIVHDPASYMVSKGSLQADFDQALRKGGFRSWIGVSGDASWLVEKLAMYISMRQ